jgi:alkyl hydroperoxide reductase subunit AhpF
MLFTLGKQAYFVAQVPAAARSVSAASASEEPREAMEYDVCIVGAGPAGLSAAIRLKQASPGRRRAHRNQHASKHMLAN